MFGWVATTYGQWIFNSCELFGGCVNKSLTTCLHVATFFLQEYFTLVFVEIEKLKTFRYVDFLRFVLSTKSGSSLCSLTYQSTLPLSLSMGLWFVRLSIWWGDFGDFFYLFLIKKKIYVKLQYRQSWFDNSEFIIWISISELWLNMNDFLEYIIYWGLFVKFGNYLSASHRPVLIFNQFYLI